MVVDDAIVVADNYVELLDHGAPVPEAAWRSASEMAVPVFTATLTIVASFLPLLMLSGAVGEFISALPLTVAIALLVSFAVAMLVTPLLSRFFIKKGLREEVPNGLRARLSPLTLMRRRYMRTIGFSMKHKPLVLAGALLAFLAGVAMLHFVPRQFFPSAERNQFVVDLFAPEGTRIELTDELARRIEKHLAQQTPVRDYSTFVGGSAPRFYYNVSPQPPASNYAQFLVNTESVRDTPPLTYRLREQPLPVPEARDRAPARPGTCHRGARGGAHFGRRHRQVEGNRRWRARVLQETPGAVYAYRLPPGTCGRCAST